MRIYENFKLLFKIINIIKISGILTKQAKENKNNKKISNKVRFNLEI